MIPQRIMGLETEFGLMCASDSGGEPPLDVEAAAAELFRPILAAGGSTNSFLPNGARLYLDVGAHPEYATAECRSVADLVANDRAGERLYAS
ncbi:MAG: proteasome accessory factor PafA2 family protein, partial [Peptidiphaga gingivicola]